MLAKLLVVAAVMLNIGLALRTANNSRDEFPTRNQTDQTNETNMTDCKRRCPCTYRTAKAEAKYNHHFKGNEAEDERKAMEELTKREEALKAKAKEEAMRDFARGAKEEAENRIRELFEREAKKEAERMATEAAAREIKQKAREERKAKEAGLNVEDFRAKRNEAKQEAKRHAKELEKEKAKQEAGEMNKLKTENATLFTEKQEAKRKAKEDFVRWEIEQNAKRKNRIMADRKAKQEAIQKALEEAGRTAYFNAVGKEKASKRWVRAAFEEVSKAATANYMVQERSDCSLSSSWLGFQLSADACATACRTIDPHAEGFVFAKDGDKNCKCTSGSCTAVADNKWGMAVYQYVQDPKIQASEWVTKGKASEGATFEEVWAKQEAEPKAKEEAEPKAKEEPRIHQWVATVKAQAVVGKEMVCHLTCPCTYRKVLGNQ